MHNTPLPSREEPEEAPVKVHHARVARTARIEVVGDPRGARQVWYLLHGYGQTATEVLERTAVLRRADRAFVAPEALSRFYVRHRERTIGASWMTSRDRELEIADTVDHLRAVPAAVSTERIPGQVTVILGFSQGVAAACRWVALGGMRPSRLFLWGGEIPPELDAEAFTNGRPGFEVVLVRGKDDASHPHEQLSTDLERLAAAEVPCRSLSFDGGHELHESTLLECARSLEELGRSRGSSG